MLLPLLILVSGNVVTVSSRATQNSTQNHEELERQSNEERSRNASVDKDGVLRFEPPPLPDPLRTGQGEGNNVGECFIKTYRPEDVS